MTEVGTKRIVNGITLKIGKYTFKQDEILTILAITPVKTIVARENGNIAILPLNALKFGTDKVE